MPITITVNEGGTRYELDTITVNEGGTEYELDSVQSNEGGTRYEIYSAVKVPSSLTWIAEHADASINVSDDGLSGTINNSANGIGVLSNIFRAPQGCVLTVTVTDIHLNNISCSGEGSIILYVGENEEDITTELIKISSSNDTQSVGLDRDRFYRLVVTGGGGYGSSSGIVTCGVTVTFSITFE